MGFSNYLTTKNGQLTANQIQSPNFVHNSTGWSIQKNGNVEFNSGTFRGTVTGGEFDGTDFIINGAGAFFYSSTPANGNLIASIAPGPGTDSFGNAYFGGISAYDSSGNVTEISSGDLFTFNQSTGIFTNLVRGVLLVYQSGGGLGNLILSAAPSSGTDQYGNAYPKGLNVTQGTISGSTFNGTDFVINSNGAFFYSSTPALGNLIASIASASGSDSFGNAYLSGISAYGSVGGVGHAASVQGGKIQLFDNVSFPSGTWPATAVATMDFNSNLDTVINTSGQLLMTDGAGLQQQVSGSKLANASTTYPVQITNTTKTSIGFMTVPANDVAVGSTFQAHASGSFSTGTSVPSSATFGVWWGGIAGTNIATLAIPGTLGASLSGAAWFLDAEVNFTSFTQCEVTLKVGWRSAAGVSNSQTYYVVANTSGLSVISSENLSLSFQWGSAPTGTNFLCDVGRLSRIA